MNSAAVLGTAALSAAALGVSLAVRPWRLLGAGGPPWSWVAACAALPLLWGAEHGPWTAPMSGAALLVLLAGWPLAVIALAAVAVVHALSADLGWAAALQQYVVLGVVPATLAMALGAVVRRALPPHPASYVVGRGFAATLLAAAAAGFCSLPASADVLIARTAMACAEAWLTAIVVACCVAARPDWLATWSDRLYLARAPRGGAP